MNIPLILSEYYRGQEWTLNGDDYEGLIWYDERNTLSKPTIEELRIKHDELIDAQPWKELRQERNRRLAEVDWVVIRAFSMNTPVTDEWKTYMQALRDLPSVTEDPANPVWPTPPE